MININLLPWREENKKKYKKLLNMEIIAVVAFVIMTVIFLHIIRGKEANFYTQQNKLLQIEIQKLNNENTQLTPFLDTQKNLIKNIDVINGLEYHRFIGVQMLNAITPIIPDDIYLTKMVFDKHTLQIEGIAASNIAISKLVDRIDKTKIFTPAKISQVSEDKYNNAVVIKFQVNTSLKTDFEPSESAEKKA